MDPAATFSVIFVDITLHKIENPITLNYTWYGFNQTYIQGEWVDVSVNVNLDGYEDPVQLDLTVFVSYMASPETGL